MFFYISSALPDFLGVHLGKGLGGNGERWQQRKLSSYFFPKIGLKGSILAYPKNDVSFSALVQQYQHYYCEAL